jgi:hypothetical protein
MRKEMPVIPVNRVVDTKRIIGGQGGGRQGVAVPKRALYVFLVLLKSKTLVHNHRMHFFIFDESLSIEI